MLYFLGGIAFAVWIGIHEYNKSVKKHLTPQYRPSGTRNKSGEKRDIG
jgi:hypothetical protein